MQISDLLSLMVLVAVVTYWLSAMQAKETARHAGRKRCQGLGLIFLDDTVVLKKLRLVRDDLGRMAIQRLYHFEFSSDGSQRYHGAVTLLGNNPVNFMMDAYRIAEQSIED